MDQLRLRLRLRLKVKVSSELGYASAESSRLESHRKSNKLPLEQPVQRVLTQTNTHTRVLWMNTHTAAAAGRAGPDRAKPSRVRLKVGCAGFYVAPDHLAIPIWIWILISIFAFRFSIFVPQCRLSTVGSAQCRRGGAGGRTGHHGLITAQVQIGPHTRRRRRSYARPGQRLDISRTCTHRNFLSLRFCVWAR